MIRFTEYLTEAGGETAGTMEVASLSLSAARSYADQTFRKAQNIPLSEAMPDFDKHFAIAQTAARRGFTQRRDMPVIDAVDVKDFQTRLQRGYIDVNAPHAAERVENPFPQGLTKEQGSRWLKDGLPLYDHGRPSDDSVKCTESKVAGGKLLPIQKQIYFDKCINSIARSGIAAARQFLSKTHLIGSSDYFIIDGHHRWMSSVLLDPAMQMNVLCISLPIKELLPLSLTYSDAIGNKRNQ
jgi:hypothetical protein